MKKGINSVDIDDIYSKVKDEDLLSYYFGVTKFPCLICSVLHKDEKPSLSIFRPKGKTRLMWKDFSTGENGGIITLLQKYWGVSLEKAKAMIWKDLPLIPEIKGLYTLGKSVSRRKEEKKELRCVVRNWRKHDEEYWSSYGISISSLKKFDVYPISTIVVTKEGVTYKIPAEKYAYVYVEKKDGKVTLKIYQPLSKTHKWSNGNDSSVWNLWSKLPKKGDTLIISSSRKDCMCIWENTGIPSISMQGEGYMPKPQIIEELKERFRNVYVLYDNDFSSSSNHGRIFGKKICQKFGLKQIEIPSEYQSKDPSDLYRNHGKKEFKKVILDLITRENNVI